MQDSASGSAWDSTTGTVTPGRRTFGQLLILATTLLLLAAVVVQGLYSLEVIDFGFDNWRPILYLYIAWGIGLCVGQVLYRGEKGQRAVFVLPAVLFTLLIVVFPTIYGLYIAMTDWNLSAPGGPKFAGLTNFRALFHDDYFWNAMGNMGIYVLSVLVQYAIAFGLAILLSQNIRGRKFFRVAFLLPFMLSPVAVSWMIGKSIFSAQNGPAADLLRWLGVAEPSFFSTPWTARTSIMLMDSWTYIPFIMVMLLAGLQALPVEVMESAKVDGASAWQTFKHMVFPLMLPVSVTAVILRIIFELKIADIIINVTGGNPGGATDSVTSYIFREYNTRSNVGYGTALAQFFLVAVIIFVTLLLGAANRWMKKVS